MCSGRPSGGGAFTKLGDFAEFGEASAFYALLLEGVSPNDLEQRPSSPQNHPASTTVTPCSTSLTPGIPGAMPGISEKSPVHSLN